MNTTFVCDRAEVENLATADPSAEGAVAPKPPERSADMNKKRRSELLGIVRKGAGMSQWELANKIGISQSQLSLVEAGHRELTPEQLSKAEDAIWDLLGPKNPQDQDPEVGKAITEWLELRNEELHAIASEAEAEAEGIATDPTSMLMGLGTLNGTLSTMSNLLAGKSPGPQLRQLEQLRPHESALVAVMRTGIERSKVAGLERKIAALQSELSIRKERLARLEKEEVFWKRMAALHRKINAAPADLPADAPEYEPLHAELDAIQAEFPTVKSEKKDKE